MFSNIQPREHIQARVGATSKVAVEGTVRMDYFEYQPVWEAGSDRAIDSFLYKVDGGVDRTIVRAIRDATQTADSALQQEAAAWLWICCPDIAEQIELPELHYEMLSTLAAAYAMGDSGNTSTWLS